MNATVHAAQILDRQRAADLDRQVELLRRQAERPESVITRPTAFAVVTEWFGKLVRPPHTPRRIAAA